MRSEEKVTEEMLDAYAAKLADRLDAILASLPKHHPDHFSDRSVLPDRSKEARHAEKGRDYGND